MDHRRWVNGRRAGFDPKQQVCFRHGLIVDERGGAYLGESRPNAAELDLESEPVARYHLPSEFRVVDAAEPHASARRCGSAIEQQHRRHLDEGLDHQHTGHQRSAREVTLEELFVDGDALDGDQSAARLVFGNRVDEVGRVAVVIPIQQRREIEGHGGLVHASGCSLLRLCSGLRCMLLNLNGNREAPFDPSRASGSPRARSTDDWLRAVCACRGPSTPEARTTVFRTTDQLASELLRPVSVPGPRQTVPHRTSESPRA